MVLFINFATTPIDGKVKTSRLPKLINSNLNLFFPVKQGDRLIIKIPLKPYQGNAELIPWLEKEAPPVV
jgi:hypothetical protein